MKKKQPSRPRRWVNRLLRCAIVAGVVSLGAFLILDQLSPFPFDRLTCFGVSPRVTDRHGALIQHRVNPEEQYRRPVALEAMSPYLVDATIAVEDARFRKHVGVDPLAVGRATLQNIFSGRVVSGASTLTMQICRMMDDRPRTLPAKIIESFRAVQLDRSWTKDRILECYLNLAPYGRNLRGVQAASQAWFGCDASDLSLAEAALLAGLPQSPARLRPDRHPDAARQRRNVVLDRMLACGSIAPDAHALAVASPIVLTPALRRPGYASHAAALARLRRPDGGQLTIDPTLQRAARSSLADRRFPDGTDVAIVIIEIETGAIRAMIGSSDPLDPVDGQVNGAIAWRSPGSALKPFVYLSAFDTGRLGPDSMVPDRRFNRDGWAPNNFDRRFRGPMRVDVALRASRNIPALLVTEAVGAPRCGATMEAAGVRFLPGRVAAAGLTLAVGGAEVRLLDLVNAYATIGRGGDAGPARLFQDEAFPLTPALPQESCRAIDWILGTHARSGDTELILREPWCMWKTGTSAGRRDAWAVGHNRRFAVGVWVGRFDGSGRPAFVGALAAEPILLDLMRDPTLYGENFAPPAPQLVRRGAPFEWPAPDGTALAILEPAPDSEYIHFNRPVPIWPRATGEGPHFWFVDDAPIQLSAHTPLRLTSGRHELRCVDADGRSASVQVTVLRRASRRQ